MNNNIVAVVVTYNRKEKLMKCLDALFSQKSGSPDILVVDNASDDGTDLELKPLIDEGKIFYLNPGRNLGGAGGFEKGVKWAVDAGYDYMWLMDDDCIPEKNALLEFKKAHNKLKGHYGFLSGKVNWIDGSPCKMNIQKASLTSKIKDWGRDLQRIQYASFVSCFIRTSVVKDVALPVGEFFIWGDDVEYTRRISRKYPCYYVKGSVAVHDCAANSGSDISKDSMERMKYYVYAYRNEFYVFRREGAKGLVYWWIRLHLHVIRILTKGDGHKLKRLWTLFKGSLMGILYNPTIDLAD